MFVGIITQIVFIVRGYNILPKFVIQLIPSSIQIIQIDSRHLLSYYMPISLVYYYTGVICDIWTLLLYSHVRSSENSVCATLTCTNKGILTTSS